MDVLAVAEEEVWFVLVAACPSPCAVAKMLLLEVEEVDCEAEVLDVLELDVVLLAEDVTVVELGRFPPLELIVTLVGSVLVVTFI